MNSNKNSDTNKKSNKKPYVKPSISRIGSLKELSQTNSMGNKTDGGAFPVNKHMCLTPPPTIEEHRILLKDVMCQSAYFAEIQKNVKPGDTVCDLGVGSGIHTLFALKAGAKKVYAIDLDPLIETAREVIFDNGYADRVEFIRGHSRKIELPEKVDVIISNIGFLHTLNDLPDAVSRFLKPGGRALPESAQISLVPMTSDNFYKSNVQNWKTAYDFNFSAFQKIAANHPQYWELPIEGMLAKPFHSSPISFVKNIVDPLKWIMEFRIDRPDFFHGIGGWYSFSSLGKEFISTQPPLQMTPELWQNFIFPLSEPIQVQAGDTIKFELEMHREQVAEAPIWIWQTSVNGTLKYRQSSFQGMSVI